MTTVSQNVYIDKLVNIINNCHNKYHIKIKMKPVEVKWIVYIDFVKGCVPNWSEKGFTIKKVKIIVPWTYIISDLIRKLLEGFVKRN